MLRDLISILLISFAVCSCGKRESTTFSPQDIAASLCRLDTLVKTEYMEGPLSQMFHDALLDSMALPSKEQMRQRLSESLKVWKHFRDLCDKQEYEAALDYYLEEPREGEMKNAGAFIFVFESKGRYEFYSNVLLPLLVKYREKNFVLNEYIQTLQFEKTLEELTIALRSEDNGYVPETYPYVLTDLGWTLATAGQIDEALALLDDLRPVYLLIYNGNELDAEVMEAGYKSRVYELSGDKQKALAVLNAIKAKMEKNDVWTVMVDDAIKELTWN